MTKKSVSKTPRKKTGVHVQEQAPDSKIALAVPENPKPVISQLEPPDPELMEQEALGEPNYRDLGNYSGSIRTLRGKGFSFREIANWLSERNVDADHNSVYRVYRKGLTYEQQAELEQQESDAEEFRNS